MLIIEIITKLLKVNLRFGEMEIYQNGFKNMKKLYKFFWEYGRMGDVDGVFVAEESALSAAMGKTICFGEILGKHSEVNGPLEEFDVEVLTDDQDFIKKFEKYRCACGYNPLDYLEEG